MPITTVQAGSLEGSFDQTFGSQLRAPPTNPRPARTWIPLASPPGGHDRVQSLLSTVAGAERGRIGVAALDLATGRSVAMLGSQPFPMASTSKIAIISTFLAGVDAGRYRLTDRYPLMVPLASPRFSGSSAPVRPGRMYDARTLINMALIHSNNQATDAILAAIGGPPAVNRWLRQAGLSGLHLDRDIATLVRDDGAINPATTIDPRDSTTPTAMVELLSGLYQGKWLSPQSRELLFSTMERCATGRNRIKGDLPEDMLVAHKTGTLNNTSSDVGIVETPDGHKIAIAIYVTGNGSHAGRDQRIARIARTVVDGYINAGGAALAAR
jgi:beta-lactamase class A